MSDYTLCLDVDCPESQFQTKYNLNHYTEMHSGHGQKSQMNFFPKTVNGSWALPIFSKRSILYVSQGSEYISTIFHME